MAEDAGFLGEVGHAELGAAVHRVAGDIGAFEENLAGVGPEQADDHAEGGGLAGAVGAEQADDFAAVEFEADLAHDGAFFKLLTSFSADKSIVCCLFYITAGTPFLSLSANERE